MKPLMLPMDVQFSCWNPSPRSSSKRGTPAVKRMLASFGASTGTMPGINFSPSSARMPNELLVQLKLEQGLELNFSVSFCHPAFRRVIKFHGTIRTFNLMLCYLHSWCRDQNIEWSVYNSATLADVYHDGEAYLCNLKVLLADH